MDRDAVSGILQVLDLCAAESFKKAADEWLLSMAARLLGLLLCDCWACEGWVGEDDSTWELLVRAEG